MRDARSRKRQLQRFLRARLAHTASHTHNLRRTARPRGLSHARQGRQRIIHQKQRTRRPHRIIHAAHNGNASPCGQGRGSKIMPVHAVALDGDENLIVPNRTAIDGNTRKGSARRADQLAAGSLHQFLNAPQAVSHSPTPLPLPWRHHGR